jgi:hypothetical protein
LSKRYGVDGAPIDRKRSVAKRVRICPGFVRRRLWRLVRSYVHDRASLASPLKQSAFGQLREFSLRLPDDNAGGVRVVG